MIRFNFETAGFGNRLIHLSQLDSKTPILDTILHDDIVFKNLMIQKDDPSLETLENPPIYINEYTMKHVHPNIRNMLEPSENIKLFKVPEIGIAIRLFEEAPGVVKTPKEIYEYVINSLDPQPMFVACESIEYKKELDSKFPGRLTFIEYPSQYLEFFLLSTCKTVFITAGNKNLQGFSTFGYMAAIYGGAEQVWIQI